MNGALLVRLTSLFRSEQGAWKLIHRHADGITYTARAYFIDGLETGNVVDLSSETLFGVFYIQTPEEH